MTRQAAKPRSIAFQLILLFTLAAGLLLACGLGIFYSIVVRHALAEDNAVLSDKMFALSSDLRENGPEAFAEELKSHPAGEHTPYSIRMLDAESRIVAETPGMDRLIPTQIFPTARDSAEALPNRHEYRTATKLFSLVAFNERSNGQTYTLQMAQDRSSDEQVERNFAVLFIVVLLGGVLASALIATIVTRRGLRPLRQMAQSLGRIGPEQLKERIGSEGGRASFNRSRWLSTRCLRDSTILLHGSRNSPLTLRTNCELPSPICWARHRSLSRGTARLSSIARQSNPPWANANASPGS